MVSFSKEWLDLYQAKKTPPEVMSKRIEKYNKQLERDLQTEMKNILHHRGIVFICSKFGKKSTIKPGWPDFTFAVNGKACAVEAKTDTGELSPDQVSVIAQMKANGWRVEVIRDLMSFKQFLDAVKKEI